MLSLVLSTMTAKNNKMMHTLFLVAALCLVSVSGFSPGFRAGALLGPPAWSHSFTTSDHSNDKKPPSRVVALEAAKVSSEKEANQERVRTTPMQPVVITSAPYVARDTALGDINSSWQPNARDVGDVAARGPRTVDVTQKKSGSSTSDSVSTSRKALPVSINTVGGAITPAWQPSARDVGDVAASGPRTVDTSKKDTSSTTSSSTSESRYVSVPVDFNKNGSQISNAWQPNARDVGDVAAAGPRTVDVTQKSGSPTSDTASASRKALPVAVNRVGSVISPAWQPSARDVGDVAAAGPRTVDVTQKSGSATSDSASASRKALPVAVNTVGSAITPAWQPSARDVGDVAAAGPRTVDVTQKSGSSATESASESRYVAVPVKFNKNGSQISNAWQPSARDVGDVAAWGPRTVDTSKKTAPSPDSSNMLPEGSSVNGQ